MLSWVESIGRKCSAIFSEPTQYSSTNEGLHPHFDLDPLSHELPYEAYDEEKEVFLNSRTIGFVLEAIPLVGSDETVSSMLGNLFQEFGQEGASIQGLLLADHRIDPFLHSWSRSKNKQEIFEAIAKERSSFYANSTSLSPRIFRFFLSYTLPLEQDIQTEVQRLSETKEKVLKSLRSFTSAFAWKPKDLLENVGGLLCFSLSPELKRRNHSPLQNLSSQITQGGGLTVEPHHLEWENGTHFKSYRVVDTPSIWSMGQMQNLIGDTLRDGFRIPHPFFIHYGVYYPPQEKAENSFWRRSQLIENQGKSGYLIRLIPELAEELRECDFIRRSLTQGAKIVWTQLSCGVWGSKESIRDAEQSIKGIFKINQFNLAENTYLHLPHLISILPMAWGDYAADLKNLDVLKTTLSSECPHFFPFQGEWMGTSTPGMILIGRRGQLLNWNPFDSKSGNYNSIVVGRSGSGKSVFMQDLLMSGLRGGARVYVLDVGRSYEKMCSMIGGQQIEFSKDSHICLNPFSKIRIDDQEDKETAFSFIKSIIASMAAPSSQTTDYENALIERAIQQAWESKGNSATITDVAHYLSQKPDERAKALSVMLTPYTKEGIYSKYFEGTNNISFMNQMVLIELEELKGKKDLQSVILQLCIMTIANDAFLGDRKTPFFICIDEAWDLLRSPQTGIFIETLARRLRKYYGSLIVGTQSVDDFFTTPGAKAAYDNSDWMCFLAQKKGSIGALAESGKIQRDETLLRALETVTTRHGEYSEVMICNADGQFAIARLILDPFSRLLYSTQAKEYGRLKDLTSSGLTVVEAIRQMLREGL
jgi:conjugal transfer ATP-binding protein TraC